MEGLPPGHKTGFVILMEEIKMGIIVGCAELEISRHMIFFYSYESVLAAQ